MTPGLLKFKFTNLIGTTILEDGGHFLSHEIPEIFTDDVYKAVQAFRDWHQENK